jgi:DNA-binding NarL/FixJ family response regulator
LSAEQLLVVEDSVPFRAMLAMLLSSRYRVDAVGTARTALSHARAHHPVCAIVDLGLPDGDGIELVRALRTLRAELPILVLTIEDGRDRVLDALGAGASGYVTKDRVVVELHDAIEAARSGGTPLSARVATHVVDALRATSPPAPPRVAVLLTESERRVLHELARGLTYDDIGVVLEISINTVRSRVRSLYEKLDVVSRTEAIVLAARLGLIRI